MSTLTDQLELLGAEAPTVRWLRQMVAEWHLIADLSFSDLVLWLPDVDDPDIFRAVAQVRPATGPTALEDDVVGDKLAYEPDSGVPEAFLSGELVETSENKLQAGVPVDVLAMPVRRPVDGVDEIVAVVERHTNQMNVRAPSRLEDNYLDIAMILTGMLCRGEFPPPGEPTEPGESLRVGDGLIRLTGSGQVCYATPNATTAYRRLGLAKDLIDADLVATTKELAAGTDVEVLRKFLASTQAREMDVTSGPVVLRLRVLPLRSSAGQLPPILLCKDISELRRRERQLITKDATIREIHHRVKNNLQTVAALLRMQSRRIASAEAKAALSEAMSRVAAIAVVHETLSHNYDEVVDFDEVADRVVGMVADVSRTASADVRVVRQGSFGPVPAHVATPLSLVITELCQNAVEHGLGDGAGTVIVSACRDDAELTVEVLDDGRGLPEGFAASTNSSLGLSIVRTLVNDLGGRFALQPAGIMGGSRAEVRLPISGPLED